MLAATLTVAGIGAGLFTIFLAVPLYQSVKSVSSYAYPNARLRALRKTLVSEEGFNDLLARPYADIIYTLDKEAFPKLGRFLEADFSYASVDSTLRRLLVRTLIKVRNMSPEQSQSFISALLSKYDIQLIESIVRSSKSDVSSIQDILHITEVFSKEFVTRDSHTLDDLYNELKGTVYEPILSKHLDDLRAGKYHDFEIELDLLFFRRLVKASTSPEAKGYTRRLIDAHNISLVFKGLSALIPGGRIRLDEFEGKTQVADVLSLLNSHNYAIDAETPEQIERQIYVRLREYGMELMKRNPLSEASIVGFIVLKTINVRNVNILLKMKYHEFSETQIREVLSL